MNKSKKSNKDTTSETATQYDEYYGEIEKNIEDTSRKSNSFRYQTFAEKISKIDINIFSKVGDVIIELEDENDSYFNQTIQVWRELNVTEHYGGFCNHIRKYHNSIAEVLLHKEKIVEILLIHLSKPNSMALKPLLSVLAALFRDLRSEIYGSFYKILKVLMDLLKQTLKPDSIEELFTSICYMLKFLEKQIIPEFFKFYQIYSQLFLQKRQYIRRFAAESMSFIMRKIVLEEMDKTLEFLNQQLEKNHQSPEYLDAFSFLLFHSVKGVKSKFHSRCEYVLPMFFQSLLKSNSTGIRFQSIYKTFEFIRYHGYNDKDNLLPIWTTLKKQSPLILQLINNNNNNNNSNSSKSKKQQQPQYGKDILSGYLSSFFRIVCHWVEFQNGSRVMDIQDLVLILEGYYQSGQVLTKLIQDGYDIGFMVSALSKTLSLLMQKTNQNSDLRVKFYKYLDSLFSIQLQSSSNGSDDGILKYSEMIFSFFSKIDSHYQREPLIINRLVKFLELNYKVLDTDRICSFFVRCFTIEQDEDEMVDYQRYPQLALPNLVNNIQSQLQKFQAQYKTISDQNVFKQLWGNFVALQCIVIPPANSKSLISTLEKTVDILYQRIQQSIKNNEKPAEEFLYLLSRGYSCLISIYSKISIESLPKVLPNILNLLKHHPSDYFILQTSSMYFQYLSVKVDMKKNKLITPEYFKEQSNLFTSNLSNRSNQIRKETLNVLKHIHQCTLTNVDNLSDQDKDIERFFEDALEIESTEFNRIESKSVSAKMESIGSIYMAGNVEIIHSLMYNYILGSFYIRFNPLWISAQKVLQQIFKKDATKVYPFFKEILLQSESNLLQNLDDEDLVDNQDDEIEEEVEEEVVEEKDDDNEEKEDGDVEEEDHVIHENDDNHEDEDSKSLATSEQPNSNANVWDITLLFQETIEISKKTNIEMNSKNIIHSFTDPVNYNSALWKTLSLLGTSVERYSKDFVTMFFEFLVNDHQKYCKSLKPLTVDILTDKIQKSIPLRIRTEQKGYSKNQSVQLYLHYLDLFSQFKKPTKIYQEQLLKQVFKLSMSSSEPKIQLKSLQCYLLWQQPELVPYKKNLENLIQDKTMKEEMAKFIVSKDSPNSSVIKEHRSEVIPLVINILMTKMNKKAYNNRSSIDTQRSNIFSYLSGLYPEELSTIFQKILSPFASVSTLPHIDVQSYFLNILQPLIKQFGSLLISHIDQIIKVILQLVNQPTPDHNMLSNTRKSKVSITQIKSQSYKRFSEILRQFPKLDYKNSVKEVFKSFSTLLSTMNQYTVSDGFKKCLLVVSENHLLVHYLNQDITLLPKLFTFINSKPHQEVIIQIIENILLAIDPTESGSQEISDKYWLVLKPHISDIINAIKSTLLSKLSLKSNSSKQLVLSPSKLSKRPLALLTEISKFAQSPEQASQLLELLVPFLRCQKYDDDDLILSVLTIFKNMLALIPNPESHVATMSQLFGVFKTRVTRSILCEIFLILGEKVSYMSELSKLLDKLNAYTKKSVTLETYDYERRLEAYSYINDNLMTTLTPQQLYPVLINYVHFLKDRDFSIKNSSATGLSKLIKHLGESIHKNDKSPEHQEKLKLLKLVFIGQMKLSFNDKEYRDEFLQLFNQLLSGFNSHEMFYPDLVPLLFSGNEDRNFFVNYYHIQKHRKKVSFFGLKTLLLQDTNEVPFSSESLNQILIPLAIQTILETSIKDGGAILGEVVKTFGAIAKKLEWRQYFALLKTLISTMDLHATRYKMFLKTLCEVIDEFHFFIDPKEISLDINSSAVKIKTISVKKPKNSTAQENGKSVTPMDVETQEERNEMEYEDGVINQSKNVVVEIQKKQAKNISEEIHNAIINALVPQLNKYLIKQKQVDQKSKDRAMESSQADSRNEGVVNLPIALAILKLYKLLPDKTSKLLYPNLIGKLCFGLKSKENEIREQTRETLVQVMDTLGYTFFPFILQEMRNVLKHGYQKYVLSYTLHALLNVLSKSLVPGTLDSQAKVIMEIIVEDLFGEPSVLREQTNMKDYNEAKSPRSLDTLRLLAQIVHYTQATELLIKPIHEIISISTNPKLLPTLQEMIKKISKGIRMNQSFQFKDLSILVYQLMTKGDQIIVKDKSEVNPYISLKPTFEETFSIQEDPSKKKQKELTSSRFTASNIFKELATSLLLSSIKRKDQIELKEYLGMLDPFISFISKNIENPETRIVYLTLKCLLLVFNLELPSMQSRLQEFTIQVLNRLQRDQGNEKITNACLEMIILILKSRQFVEEKKLLTDTQIQGILSIIKQHLAMNNSDQNTQRSLMMLHALILKKTMIPEIYDLMDMSCSIMIRSFKPHIQNMISQILIDFILFYPMGDARLKDQITFLIKNLTYQVEEGRLIVLKTIQHIINRFPEEVLNTYAQVLYLPMVVRLGNDTSAKCRELVGQNIKMLLEAVGHQVLDKIYQITVLWYESNKNPAMTRVSAQILGIIAQSSSFNHFQKYIKPLLAPTVKYLEHTLSLLSEKENESQLLSIGDSDETNEDSSTKLPGWQLSYSILCSFEHILQSNKSLVNSKDFESFWLTTVQYLNYPHIWVRTSVTRLYGILFTNQSTPDLVTFLEKLYSTNNTSKSSTKFNIIFTNSETLFTVTKKHCSILNSKLLTDDLGLQITKNLIYLSMVFYKCSSIKPPKSTTTTSDDITPNIFKSISKNSINSNGNGKVDNDDDNDIEMEDNENSDEEENNEMEQDGEVEDEEDLIVGDEQKQEGTMLLWLFKRLSYMATKIGLLRRKYIFRWIGALTTQLSAKELEPYLQILLVPLVKTTDEKIHATKPERKLAQEVLDQVKKRMGTSRFTVVYQQIVQSNEQIRALRKQERKLQAVSNPKEYLQQKREQRQKEKERKKRKSKTAYSEFMDFNKKIRVPHVVQSNDDPEYIDNTNRKYGPDDDDF
ncbi:HEAT repeat-containing protein [Tieghemostelium lacteum]|uniref:HEAT repeat-containing protein n=1 Tax=Tieghemostelium lacteum TaxID=361077 RepID=A0A151Z932_TIELA|nr:HEAT repeat-containing protein [Tieghemostelium lacteum]|eukprot:KYQ90452.1 HEAT repeat-containing protein [Tieghemostelium lacteum]